MPERNSDARAAELAEHDAWFRRQVQEGLADADSGRLIAHEDVEAEFARRRARPARQPTLIACVARVTVPSSSVQAKSSVPLSVAFRKKAM